MEDIKLKIKELARVYHSEIIAIRRHIHSNPELGFEEFETSSFVSNQLSKIGIEHSTVAKTGVLGIIKGNNPEKTSIALRADMDALPILEENDITYRSKNKGIMHACGHDAHTACLLGAARILNELRNNFEGTVKLFFQPSEEKFPGGAEAMIKDGVLENPDVEAVFGQHVMPELESGKLGFRSGKYMASTDELYLTVKGRGGHGATPNLNVDTVVIAANIVVTLQQIVSRIAPPDIPTVLSFGRFIADGRTNIIPDKVTIDGTLRTFDEDWRKEAHHKIKKLAGSVAESMGGECEINIAKGYPYLVNDKEKTERAKQLAIEYAGNENVIDIDMRMTAEDFSYFALKKPSTYYRLGIRNEKKGITSNLHTSTFNIDEKSLELGAGYMAWLAINELESK
jgi:amidohydrolase